jgi:hypothetical protein
MKWNIRIVYIQMTLLWTEHDPQREIEPRNGNGIYKGVASRLSLGTKTQDPQMR